MYKMMAEASGFTWFLAFGFTAMAIFIIGLVAHTVLSDRGFGTVGNGLLVFFGLAMGAGVRYVTFGF